MGDGVRAAQTSTSGLFNVSSKFAPRIYGVDADGADLAALLCRLDAMNISLGTVLRGVPAEIFVSFYATNKHGGIRGAIEDKVRMSLDCVRFDPNAVHIPAFNAQYVNGEGFVTC
jgi:hypothetical protein